MRGESARRQRGNFFPIVFNIKRQSNEISSQSLDYIRRTLAEKSYEFHRSTQNRVIILMLVSMSTVSYNPEWREKKGG